MPQLNGALREVERLSRELRRQKIELDARERELATAMKSADEDPQFVNKRIVELENHIGIIESRWKEQADKASKAEVKRKALEAKFRYYEQQILSGIRNDAGQPYSGATAAAIDR